jgi:hypothetical protein
VDASFLLHVALHTGELAADQRSHSQVARQAMWEGTDSNEALLVEVRELRASHGSFRAPPLCDREKSR